MKSATDLPTLGQRLGDFEIVREAGRGGMGVVYEARQISLNRKVALKVLSSTLGLTPKAVQRFRSEAEAAAKLHHTNIVPVYAIGEEAGTHFYAMELIGGPSLDKVIRQLREARDARPSTSSATSANDPAATGPYIEGSGPATGDATPLTSFSLGLESRYFDTVAKMIADVAEALDYAHRQGVIHRDIKPSNLLLSPDGRLTINDFGLARVLEQPGMTVTGEILGTPMYMSPEQITAGHARLDQRTDVYSLGATLYELLTWEPPFRGERRDQILAQVLHKEPRPPRQLNRSVPIDLQTICLKAMDKDAARRYSSAGAMAEDLRRYVNRFAILARRAGPVTRLRKWVKRRPGLAAALACLIVAIVGAGFFAWQANDAEQRRRAEGRQAAFDKAQLHGMTGEFGDAEKAITEAEQLGALPGQVLMLKGQLALHRADAETALRELREAVRLMPRSVAARALLGLAHMENNDVGVAFTEDQTALAGLEPSTPEDYLFLGQFEALNDPQRGLKWLDEAVDRRPNSPVIRLARGQALTLHAMDTADPEDAAKAVDDAGFARRALPDNAAALSASLQSQLVKARVCRRHGRTKEGDEALVLAARENQALEAVPGASAGTLLCRCTYLEYAGQIDACLELASRARARGEAADLLCAVLLAERGDYAGALDVVRPNSPASTQAWYLTGRGFVLAIQPDAPARVRAGYDRAARLPRSDTMVDLYPQTILRLLGPDHKEEATRICCEINKRRSHWPPAKRAWYLKLLDYNCGSCSAEELLHAAKHSLLSQCEGHFFIATTCLADGDRRGARKHFEAAVETDVFGFNEYTWSRLLLARMKQDETWPRWIPDTKD